MRANDTSSFAPTADQLTPLEISRAVLECEENPNTLRAITPLEQAASGVDASVAGRQSALGRVLGNPAFAWGAAAAAGLGLVAALAFATRESRPNWRVLGRLRSWN